MRPFSRLSSELYFKCSIAILIVGTIIFSVFIGIETNAPDSSPISYHVSIQFEKKHHCSGSLISIKLVLTAAHCFDNGVSISRTKVAVGMNRVPGGTIYDIDTITRHDSYNPKNQAANIAVIRLKRKVSIESKIVQIIQLPKREQMMRYGQEVNISEFNLEQFTKPTSWAIKKFTGYVVDETNCGYHYFLLSMSDKFCAVIYPEYNVETDSGSPVTVKEKYVVGINLGASLVDICTGIPNVYTHVPTYLDFIEKEMARSKD